jgi:hypothetical protein
MGKSIEDRVERTIEANRKAPAELTVKEAMLKRDTDLRSAMRSLSNATDKTIDAAAKLLQANDPVELAKLQKSLRAAVNTGDLESHTLAGEIRAVAMRISRLEVALARATHRTRRRAA